MNKITEFDDGVYSANLLGNIKSHLAGLQGYDIMALELIQNADDAKSESITFNITHEGLEVINNGCFSYCRNLKDKLCGLVSTKGSSCDFHRIADVGSGGKGANSDYIGRFGIGFVSTYQITDNPEIRSSGVNLTLFPEKGRWTLKAFDQPEGTVFFLPWAKDPSSETRIALGRSNVTTEHISLLEKEFESVLRRSLLFLRHIKKAEIRKNDELLLACELKRNDSNLTVKYLPSKDEEQWYILRADAAEHAEPLYIKHPQLKSHGRSTKISVGLRIDQEPLEEGFLYAYLPTEQSSGLPMHINADFFPEPDRKAVIFAGNQHEQAWNEMLIEVAADELARDPEKLLEILGHKCFWQTMSSAYQISLQSKPPMCFKQYWHCLKKTVSHAQVILTRNESMLCPADVLHTSIDLNIDQVRMLEELGGSVAVNSLNKYKNILNALGANELVFEGFVNGLSNILKHSESQVEREKLEVFYIPLWKTIDSLLPTATNITANQRNSINVLKEIPLLVTEDLYLVSISQSYAAGEKLDARRIATILPQLAIASQSVAQFSEFSKLIADLKLSSIAEHLDNKEIESYLKNEKQYLSYFYDFLSILDQQYESSEEVYETLRDLPIWLSGQGLIKASQTLLPGDFTDPTGQAELLDLSVLSNSARSFISKKLGVQTQTIQAFVTQILPGFFNKDGPLDSQKYKQLISELSNYPKLIDDKDTCAVLGGLPLVPTQDGRWSNPKNAYRYSDDLVEIFGEATHLWLDENRIPNVPSVNFFIEGLGLAKAPKAKHLVERIISIAENSLPTGKAVNESAVAFYVLCDNYNNWKDKSFLQDALQKLKAVECFPAIDNNETWFLSRELYTPYRAEAFSSQVDILGFRNTQRLDQGLLESLNVALKPETSLIIEHLRNCVKTNIPVPYTTYQILNERAKDEFELVSSLSGEPFLYIEDQKIYVRTNEIFWEEQELGRYAFTILRKFENFRSLFEAVGVRNAPSVQDYINIIFNIISDHYEKSKPIVGVELAIYNKCFKEISAVNKIESIPEEDIKRLREAPSVLSIEGYLQYPDEVLIHDSYWYSDFFLGDLGRALCKPEHENWPFLELVGVRKLSENAEVILESKQGVSVSESKVTRELRERVDVVLRLLHDKPPELRLKVRDALLSLSTVSFEKISVKASVSIGASKVTSNPANVSAFYDPDESQLVLTRPIENCKWPLILNTIFYQLMPEESGSEISKITIMVGPRMRMSVVDAHEDLTDSGIPKLDEKEKDYCTEDLVSKRLDSMESISNPIDEVDSTCGVKSPKEAALGGAIKSEKETTQATAPLSTNSTISNFSKLKDLLDKKNQAEQGSHETSISDIKQSQVKDNQIKNDSISDGLSVSKFSFSGEMHNKSVRPKYKQQWDRRLASYVSKSTDESNNSFKRENSLEHNLAVEMVARDAVCEYERKRGRIAEQMPQTHPGHDIISRDAAGEERFIEIKGVNGEWKSTGVGLSKLQFNQSLDFGERYWLYVVEFVSDPKNIRIHPICSPASQVTTFMFDGGWRDAVTDEKSDPTALFVTGARIQHHTMGKGEIVDVLVRGSTKLLTVQFDDKEQVTRNVSLNLHSINILEEANGNLDT